MVLKINFQNRHNITLNNTGSLITEATPTKSDRRIPSDLVRFRQIWSDWVRFGRIRSDSVGFGRILIIGKFGWTLSDLDSVRFGRIWSDLVGF